MPRIFDYHQRCFGCKALKASTLVYLITLFALIIYCICITKQNASVPSSFKFNQPIEAKVVSKELVKKFNRLKEVQHSNSIKLSDIENIKEQNSDLLSISSAFGTDFSNPEWARNICTGVDEERCAGISRNVETMLRFAPSYKTMSCIVQKNMSTMLQALMCFLFDEKKFKQANRVFSLEGYWFRMCLGKNEYNSTAEAKEALHLTDRDMDDWLYLTIVRDPVERFLSAYTDKCIIDNQRQSFCNGCNRNMTCFVITEYERIMKNSLSEFPSRTFEDLHFFPQLWHCNFSSEIQKYKLLYYSSAPQYAGKFTDDLLDLLRIQKIPEESLQFIKNQLTGGRTVHSTVTSEARVFYEERLRSSPFLMEYIVRMYYWDYKLLGFQLPTF